MNRRVLIIEDNLENMYLLKFLLEKNGFSVIQAFSGIEGIEQAQCCSPGLILLDIQLPGMDGYSVAKELRSIESLKEIPIIAVTSYAMVGDRERALASGASGYIEKPINPETFVNEVLQILEL